MKRKLHNRIHDENISFHRERTGKSNKINNLSFEDGGIMALAGTTHEYHR